MRQRYGRIVKAFSGLSLEKKLSIFFVPVFAALAGTLIPRYLSGDDRQPLPQTAGREESLEVIDLVSVNSTYPAQAPATAELRVLVRNTGEVDSLINSAEVRVVQFEPTERCVPRQGELAVSGTINLAQRIPAGEPDLFSLKVRLGGEGLGELNGDSRLYLLRILLHHDNKKTPVEAGRAVVAIPFPEPYMFADAGGAATFGGSSSIPSAQGATSNAFGGCSPSQRNDPMRSSNSPQTPRPTSAANTSRR
jgi:hypothetical protein